MPDPKAVIELPRRVRKSRKKKRKQEVYLELSDYQYTSEKQHYWTSVGAVVFVSFWIAGLVFYYTFEMYPYQWSYLPLWVILSPLLVNYFSAQPRRQQLKKLGPTAKVWANNLPHYHRMLTRLSKLADLHPAPDMYVLEEEAPYIYSLPGRKATIIATTALAEVLAPEEVEVLVAHEIGHIKSHHLRLDLAMTFVDNVNPLLKFAFGPVTVWRVLMGSWRDVIEYSADRVAILLTQNPVALMRAIIKSAAAADEQAELEQEEIDAYLQAADDVGTDAAQIERLLKMSEFVKSQPNMRERLQEIGEYLSSDEAKAAFEKMGQIRQELGQG